MNKKNKYVIWTCYIEKELKIIYFIIDMKTMKICYSYQNKNNAKEILNGLNGKAA